MNNSTLRTALLVAGLVLSPLAGPFAQAQLVDLSVIQKNGVAAMREGKWEAALEFFATACERLDQNALTLYGPRFGYFWYHKGYCELKLKQYEAAVNSFEVCYSKYANKEGATSSNRYEKTALLKWGDALRESGDYDSALGKYEKFLDERDRDRDRFNAGELYLAMAACNFKKAEPDFAEGADKFRTALDNKERFKVSDYQIMATFNFFCEGLLTSRKESSEKEQVFADFMREYRDDFSLDAYLAVEFSPLMLKLAYAAYGEKLYEMSSRLLTLIPPSSYALSEAQAQLAAIGSLKGVRDGRQVKAKDSLNKLVSKLRVDLKRDAISDAQALMIVGNHAAAVRNYRAAYGAFLQLEQAFPEHANRKDSLFQLVQLAAIMRDVTLTREYGDRFIAVFPESEQAPIVKGMMLTSLFAAREYEQCIQLAQGMLGTLEEGTKEHDTCLHVLGGANYYLGQFEAAKPYLVKHQELYVSEPAASTSDFKVASSYFYAAIALRLQDFEQGRSRLLSFLKNFPDAAENPFKALALYDLASCHIQLEQENEALDRLAQLEENFSDSGVIGQAMVLRGSILADAERKPEAEKAYLRGLEIAEKRNNDFSASEALYHLVRMASEGELASDSLKQARAYYLKFFEQYPDSPFRPDMAIVGMEIMNSGDDLDQALANLQKVIVDVGTTKSRSIEVLERAIGVYTDAYLQKNTPEKLLEHYLTFDNVGANETELRALLTIAAIGVFESVIEKADDDEQKRIAAESTVQVQFERLRREFAPEQMTNYVAIRLGDYLRTKTKNPAEALPYFDRVLTNPDDKAFIEEARFGKADVLGRSSNVAENDQALEILRGLLNDENLDGAKKTEARYRIIKVVENKEDWAALEKETLAYLDDRGNKLNRPEVAYLHAVAFDKQDKMDAALQAYIQLDAAYAAYVKYAAPGHLAFIRLMDQRGQVNDNGKTDIQLAYERAYSWVNAMRRNVGKMSAEDAALFNQVDAEVRKLEGSGRIKTMDQIRAEENQ